MSFDLMTARASGMLAMDFGIVFCVLLAVRFLYGATTGVSATDEVAARDNFAFGISLAGATGAIAVMLTGVSSGAFARTFAAEASAMVAYGAAGLVMMWLTRQLFDKLSLPKFSVNEEIGKGNVAVAVVDAGNLVATAIMVRAVMIWSEGALLPALVAVGVGYVASQIILTLASVYRIQVFRMRNEGTNFQAAVQSGNLALALRFVGFRFGVALAVTAASGLTPYDPAGNPLLQAAVWGAVSLGLAVVLTVLTLIAQRLVLIKIDVADEVDRQRNVGVGMIEAAVYIAVGLLFTGLLA